MRTFFHLIKINLQMKPIFILLVLSSLFFSFTIKDLKNDLQKEGLKGKVKSVTSILGTYHYDLQGHKIEYFRKTMSLETEKKTFKYDSKGNIIEEKEFLANGKLRRKQIFEYDEFDNLTSKIDSCHYFSKHTFKNNYNESSKIIEAQAYDSENKYLGKTTFTYDKNQNKIMESRFYNDGRLHSYTKYEKGNIIEESNLTVTQKKNYKYNLKGNPVKRKAYNFDGSLYSITKYNKAGSRIKEVSYKSRDKGRKTIFKYDSHGNPVKSISYDKTGMKHKTSYKTFYDHEGNWIKKMFIDRKLPGKENVLERQIEYY